MANNWTDVKPKSRIVIVAQPTRINLHQYLPAVFIGVEAGTLALLEQNLPPVCAIGDQDSLTLEQWQALPSTIKKINVIAEKDFTDTELAIRIAILVFNPREIILISAGPRLDMEFSLLHLLAKYHSFNVSYINNFQQVYYLGPGTKKWSPPPNYHYFSFIPILPTTLTITNAKYTLSKPTDLSPGDDLCISNEFVDAKTPVTITIERGAGYLMFLPALTGFKV